MKPRDLIACFFAGYGVYLVVVSLLGVLSALTMISAMIPSGINGSFRLAGMSTLLVGLIPMAIGVLLAVMSSRLAGVAARAAGVDPEARWEIQIPATSLLAIVIAVLGLFLAVTRGAEAVRTLALQFAANTGGTTVVRSAAMQTRPVSEIVANLVCIGAGIFLARKCASIATRILPGADPV